jgi:hypothetical protein
MLAVVKVSCLLCWLKGVDVIGCDLSVPNIENVELIAIKNVEFLVADLKKFLPEIVLTWWLALMS